MTKENVYVPPLTIAEAAWLVAAAGREQSRLIRRGLRHTLADSVIPKLDQAIDETVNAAHPTETMVMARADYAALSKADRADVDGRWASTPEHVKEQLRDDAELDLL